MAHDSLDYQASAPEPNPLRNAQPFEASTPKLVTSYALTPRRVARWYDDPCFPALRLLGTEAYPPRVELEHLRPAPHALWLSLRASPYWRYSPRFRNVVADHRGSWFDAAGRTSTTTGGVADPGRRPQSAPEAPPTSILFHPLGNQAPIPTSGFSRHRMHPVFLRIRPHFGQDFGIGPGCPVYATHSGMVSRKGRAIVLTSDERSPEADSWQSRYRHIRLADHLKPGDRVVGGDLIGFVNPTERGTTGSHLHYERLYRAPDLEGAWNDTARGPVYKLASGWAFVDPTQFIYSRERKRMNYSAGLRDDESGQSASQSIADRPL